MTQKLSQEVLDEIARADALNDKERNTETKEAGVHSRPESTAGSSWPERVGFKATRNGAAKVPPRSK